MNTLTRILAVVLFSTMAGALFAQTLGIKAGYTLSDMLAKDDEETYNDNFNMRSGLHVGPTLELEVNEGISFETALLLTTKGVRMEESVSFEGENYSSKADLNLWYLDIPFYARVFTEVENTTIYCLAGFFLDCGLSGKMKYDDSYGSESYSGEENVSWGSGDDDDLKRFGMGIGVGGGVEFNSFLIEFTGHFGLNNISPDSDSDATVKNRAFMFSVGYKFHK